MRNSCFLPAIFCLFHLLSGCAGFSGNTFGPDKYSALYDDVGIKSSITSELLKEDASRANVINVHCFNGHVFLVGEADKDFRDTALDMARKTGGVTHVTTHWFPPGTASTLRDATIEGKIDLARFFAEEHEPTTANLDVWGGHVVLTGLADDQADIDRALAAIRKLPMVKGVTSYIELVRQS